jgi:carbamoyltransferase
MRAAIFQDVCATLQRAFVEEVSAAILERTQQRDTLYLTGGAGLNIPNNAALQRRFNEVWVPPPTNDGGLALGAAALVEHLDHGALPIHSPFMHCFDAPGGEPGAAQIPEVARRLLAGEVIGVCNGAAEVGPRALGHRSLLARADDIPLRVRVSEALKRREWYRPVAPILCEAAAREVLDPVALKSPLSRWMLGAWDVRAEARGALAGVIHGDGSVRAQVVADDGSNDWMHALLSHLWREHGVPALINTSFNGPGQPIVQRPAEALRAARDMGLDAVVLHGSLH